MDLFEITQDLAIDQDKLLAKLQKDLQDIQAGNIKDNTNKLTRSYKLD